MKQIQTRVISAVLILASLVAVLAGCDAKDPFVTLVSDILTNKAPAESRQITEADGTLSLAYNFEAEVTVSFDKASLPFGDYSDVQSGALNVVPDSFTILLKGAAKHAKTSRAVNFRSVDITASVKEVPLLSSTIYIRDNTLYFEYNRFTSVILDTLMSGSAVDAEIKRLFEKTVKAGSVLTVDIAELTDTTDILSAFAMDGVTVDSTVTRTPPASDGNVTWKSTADLTENTLSYESVMKDIQKILLRTPYYRYGVFHIVITPASADKKGELNIFATRENNLSEELTPFPLAVDIAKYKSDPEALFGADIFPMRYMLELMGYEVGWNSETKQAYIVGSDNKIYYFKGTLVNNTMYVSIDEITKYASFIVYEAGTDEESTDYIFERYDYTN
ncbi:hypothetical protein FACS1894105_07880 [Clostridia bacterium]|nr:hypothetical protein FACS1894105_07880 [Clostridia bacterium]